MGATMAPIALGLQFNRYIFAPFPFHPANAAISAP
jgi:hypothetical protein